MIVKDIEHQTITRRDFLTIVALTSVATMVAIVALTMLGVL